MTRTDVIETTRSGAERIRSAAAGLGLSPERLQEVTGQLAAAAEGRGTELRHRLAAATRDRTGRVDAERRPPRRLPRGVGPTVRILGMAWATLMLSTLTVAFLSRASTRRLPATDPEANEIRIRTDLGPMAFTSRATAFRGGVIECWYGGGFVDLREATLDPAGAVLHVRAVFGGGQIIVPDGWRVVRRVRGIGGMTDLRPAVERAEDAPLLTIEGVALFGGFSVESTISPKTRADLEKAVRKMHGTEPDPKLDLDLDLDAVATV